MTTTDMTTMKRLGLILTTGLILTAIAGSAAAQTCYTGNDMQASTQTSLQSAANQYLQAMQQDNTASLQQNAEFNLAGVAEENKALLGGQATVRAVYVLDNTSAAGQGKNRVEFYCGIFNSPDRVGFIFPTLPPGQYGIVIQDLTGGKTPSTATWILHQNGGWKIAGFYAKPKQIGGHDADWYITQARAYHAKGQNYNAWFYYSVADDLMRPFPAMATPQSDQIYDEMQAVKPADLPVSAPTDLMVNGRTVRLTQVRAIPVGDNLDLVVKYENSDISDTSKAFQDNTAVIKALITKFPQLRDAFAGVVARAVAPNGQDYGTLLAMKDVK